MQARLSQRAHDYWRVASRMAAYALLGLIWLAVINQFIGAMAPRLNHLGAGGILISDWPCDSPECDFAGFWPAGVLARAHRLTDIYQPTEFLRYLHQVFSADAGRIRWFYPPPTLLPSIAISYLPFELGFVVWSACFTFCSIAVLRVSSLPKLVIVVAMLSPAALWNFELGQFGVVMAGFLVCGLLLTDEAPLMGGGLLGMLIFKPQYGLLVPVALFARRNWIAVLSCVVVAAVILFLTTAVLGWAIWPLYFTQGLEVSRQVLNAAPSSATYLKFGVSIFWMMRSFGAGLELSYAAQGISALVAIALTWQVWRPGNFNNIERMAITVFCSLLATPYGYTDDMVAWSIALAALVQLRGWRVGLLDVLFWLWPMLCPVVFMKTGLLLTPVIVTILLAQTWCRGGMPVVAGVKRGAYAV